MQSFAGQAELGEFLQGTRVLINLLPNTAETAGIVNQTLLAQLPDESYVLNLARGVHVVEEDLLAALNSGKLKGAMLRCLQSRTAAAGEPAMGASAGGHRLPPCGGSDPSNGSYHLHCGDH